MSQFLVCAAVLSARIAAPAARRPDHQALPVVHLMREVGGDWSASATYALDPSEPWKAVPEREWAGQWFIELEEYQDEWRCGSPVRGGPSWSASVDEYPTLREAWAAFDEWARENY